jgi:hypothetical protein
LPADVLTYCGKPMTDMHLWNTPIARLRGLLVATIGLGVLLFVVATTQATSGKQQTHHGTAAGQTAASAVPAAPAGPRGPITLTCSPGGAGVVDADAPAGPQGPIGVKCAASPNG